MKTEFFIARKILKKAKGEKNLSKPVVRISTLSIVLGIAIMIVTVSIVKGFQGAIREKVVGFAAHIQITEIGTNYSMESAPILKDQDFIANLNSIEEIKHIQPYGYKPGVLQNFQDSVTFEYEGTSETTSSNDILGVLFKGVDSSYNWDFIAKNITQGTIPNFDSTENQVVISEDIANSLGYQLYDEINAFFIIDNQPKKRSFTIAGIYNTGFSEFDKKLIFCDLKNIQELNNWGVQTYIVVEDSCYGRDYILTARVKGGNHNYLYDWGNNYKTKPFFTFSGKTNESIKLIAGDFEREIYGISNDLAFLPDTAFATILVDSACGCNEYVNRDWDRGSDPNHVSMPFGQVEIKQGKGTSEYYAGGFEIALHNYDDLDLVDEKIYLEIPFDYDAEKITERYPGIFSWLNILDMNINIVIILILAVSLINMITSLLVLILEKTNMIGILKAIGATNRNVRLIFLYHSFYLLGKGLFWGNLLGIGVILLQHYTGFMKLNPEAYFLDTVPVNLNIWYIVAINLLTIIVCRIILILPSLLITRITPVKAIKFD